MERGDSSYDTDKDILGFNFDGVLKTLWLEDAQRNSLLTILASWCRRTTLRRGTPWQEFISVTAYIRSPRFDQRPSGQRPPVPLQSNIETPTVPSSRVFSSQQSARSAAASPLTPFHSPGIHNAMTDIPSRSWGSNPAWKCNSADDLRDLFNSRFPLPNQASWTVYQVSSAVSMRVISALRHRHLTLAEWRQLPPHGKNIGPIGPATSNLWE